MPNKVAQHKIDGVRRDLLKGKDYTKTLLNNDYSESTAKQGIRNKVIQEALIQNSTELAENGWDAKGRIRFLDWMANENKQNYLKAKTSKDKKDWMRHIEASSSIIVANCKQESTQQVNVIKVVSEGRAKILERLQEKTPQDIVVKTPPDKV